MNWNGVMPAAGGFTGSRYAGKILMNLAASRPEPIPFFAEMSSTNPVFVLAGALQQNLGKIAAGLPASFILGVGQFCTKPGLVFLPEGADAHQFRMKLQEAMRTSASFHLLTEGIRSSYESGIQSGNCNANLILVSEVPGNGTSAILVVLFETDAPSFLHDPDLEEEIFGPSTLLVCHSKREELLEIARGLGRTCNGNHSRNRRGPGRV